jgi:putative flippase GtrA
VSARACSDELSTNRGLRAELSDGSSRSDTQPTLRRWLKFNFVGGIGIGVQFGALFLLNSVLHVHYLVAAVIAVELAVVHNFIWHERFTWADRTMTARSARPNSGAKAPNSLSAVIAALKRCATPMLLRSMPLRSMPLQSRIRRLFRFNLANGAVSILGNVSLMKVMVGEGHMNYLVANGIAIAVCSVANFVVSDAWVFEG